MKQRVHLMQRFPRTVLRRVCLLGLVLATGCERDHVLDVKTGEAAFLGFEVESAAAGELASGTVFFADASNRDHPRIVEVNRAGEVVWQYRVPPELVLATSLMDVAPTPGGGALFVVDGVGAFEVDAEGELVHAFESIQPSHDIDLLDDGSWLLTNGWARMGEPHFMIVTPEGETTWEWLGLDQYGMLPYTDIYREGWMHANAAQRQPDGSLLVSLRNFYRVVMLDPAGDPVWEIQFDEIDPDAYDAGEYDVVEGRNPHEPELTPDGTVLVALHRPSQVVEVDVETQEVVWRWSPPDDDGATIRDANRLSNGNTLVTAAHAIFELSPDGAVLWKLRSNVDRSEADVSGSVRSFYKAVLIDDDGEVYGG